MTNTEFAKNDSSFRTACEAVGLEPTARQAADIYTKGFDNALKWDHASRNIGIVDNGEFVWKEMNDHVNRSDDVTICPTDTDRSDSDSDRSWSACPSLLEPLQYCLIARLQRTVLEECIQRLDRIE